MPKEEIVPLDQIQARILVLRGQRVLLDSDLAGLYGVATHRFNEAIKRNAERFPNDFRFRLTHQELSSLSSQFAMSSKRHRAAVYLPWAFSEYGALMAANVLNSPHAVQMSIVVVRAFFALRRMILDHKTLSLKLAELDARVGGHDKQLAEIVEAIRFLTAPEGPEHGRRIGFNPGNP